MPHPITLIILGYYGNSVAEGPVESPPSDDWSPCDLDDCNRFGSCKDMQRRELSVTATYDGKDVHVPMVLYFCAHHEGWEIDAACEKYQPSRLQVMGEVIRKS